jgi:uncharacterized membrane protein
MKFGIYLHVVTFHTCELREILCTERHTFLNGMIEILYIFSTISSNSVRIPRRVSPT